MYHTFTASRRVKKMPREHHLFQYCPITATGYRSARMGERENGKRQETSRDQTFPELRLSVGLYQLQLHLTEFDLPMLKKKKKKSP